MSLLNEIVPTSDPAEVELEAPSLPMPQIQPGATTQTTQLPTPTPSPPISTTISANMPQGSLLAANGTMPRRLPRIRNRVHPYNPHSASSSGSASSSSVTTTNNNSTATSAGPPLRTKTQSELGELELAKELLSEALQHTRDIADRAKRQEARLLFLSRYLDSV
ncbi:hypothetical protein FA13DRAFT_1716218 [Coprinellus micaceus]|uniref:Uncharacterized protein n=1 Tax=Coprinellus micaceus TaxID=71717 RepID=A0A4Y7SK88_COPMI|nr:hypothetical protein FA13DRAFT_1716218 [Coprinellus micaceus]